MKDFAGKSIFRKTLVFSVSNLYRPTLRGASPSENVLVHPKSYRPPPPTLHLQSIKTVTMATTEDLQYMYDLLDKKVPGLLHQGFGYVLLVVFATYMVAFIQGFLVGKAREKYKVELPTMYSDTEQMFNCYQRVHQNTLERVPLFLAILLLAALFNSIIAAVIGAIWVAGRVIYSIGYYSGVPNNRIVGSLVSFCLSISSSTFEHGTI